MTLSKKLLKVSAASIAMLAMPCYGQEPAEADESAEAEAAADESKEEKDPNRGRFLVLPLVITEPAIGEGLGAGVVYFHRKPEPRKRRVESGKSLARTGRGQKPPPTATGVFGAYTTSDTAAVGIGHSRTFKDDAYRMTAALLSARVNATYYIADFPFDFSMEGAALFGNFKKRIGEPNVLVGVSLTAIDAESTFGDGADDAGLFSTEFTDVGLAGIVSYDTRDDTMMPSTGQIYDLNLAVHNDIIGGDFDYQSATFKANSFHKFAEKWVLGLRFEGSIAGGDVPFYAEPFVSLRGIPALRYSGEFAGVFETELRYQFAKRWAVLGFAGAGFVGTAEGIEDTEDDIKAWGFGVRFQALKTQNVWLGLDLARGPEEDAYYIQMVHPW